MSWKSETVRVGINKDNKAENKGRRAYIVTLITLETSLRKARKGFARGVRSSDVVAPFRAFTLL